MLPTHHGLETDQLVVRETDDRLVENLEAALVDRLSQLPLELSALRALALRFGAEDLGAIAAELLGAMHGDLGIAHQLAGPLDAPVVDRNADRASQHDLLPGDPNGGSQ